MKRNIHIYLLYITKLTGKAGDQQSVATTHFCKIVGLGSLCPAINRGKQQNWTLVVQAYLIRNQSFHFMLCW